MSAPYEEYPNQKASRTSTRTLLVLLVIATLGIGAVMWFQASRTNEAVAPKSSEGMLNVPDNRTPAPAPSPDDAENAPPMDDNYYVPIPPKKGIESPELPDLLAEAEARFNAKLELATASTTAEKQQFAVLYACANYFSDLDYGAAVASFEATLVNSKNPNEFSDAVAVACPETVYAYDELVKAGIIKPYTTTPVPTSPYAPPPGNPGTDDTDPDSYTA